MLGRTGRTSKLCSRAAWTTGAQPSAWAPIILTVVEHYSIPIAGGRVVDGQNSVSATTTIHLNDSKTEITNLVLTFLDDFVIPVFYLRGGTLRAAWATVRSEVLATNAGPVVIFFLLKILLGVGFVLLGTLTACLTCCIAALPYLSSVALLPAHVFFRAYSLYFLEELGLSVFPPKPPVETYAHYPQRFGS